MGRRAFRSGRHGWTASWAPLPPSPAAPPRLGPLRPSVLNSTAAPPFRGPRPCRAFLHPRGRGRHRLWAAAGGPRAPGRFCQGLSHRPPHSAPQRSGPATPRSPAAGALASPAGLGGRGKEARRPRGGGTAPENTNARDHPRPGRAETNARAPRSLLWLRNRAPRHAHRRHTPAPAAPAAPAPASRSAPAGGTTPDRGAPGPRTAPPPRPGCSGPPPLRGRPGAREEGAGPQPPPHLVQVHVGPRALRKHLVHGRLHLLPRRPKRPGSLPGRRRFFRCAPRRGRSRLRRPADSMVPPSPAPAGSARSAARRSAREAARGPRGRPQGRTGRPTGPAHGGAPERPTRKRTDREKSQPTDGRKYLRVVCVWHGADVRRENRRPQQPDKRAESKLGEGLRDVSPKRTHEWPLSPWKDAHHPGC